MVGLRRGDGLFGMLAAGDCLVTNADQHAITYNQRQTGDAEARLFHVEFLCRTKEREAWWHRLEIPGKYGLTRHAGSQRSCRVSPCAGPLRYKSERFPE